MFIYVKPESFADVIADCTSNLRVSYEILSNDEKGDKKPEALIVMGKAIAVLEVIGNILDDAVQGGDAR